MEYKTGDKFRSKNFPDRTWELMEVDNINKLYNLKEKSLGVDLEITESLLKECYEKITGENQSVHCDHDWNTYIGFTEFYEFCKKCGEKKYV